MKKIINILVIFACFFSYEISSAATFSALGEATSNASLSYVQNINNACISARAAAVDYAKNSVCFESGYRESTCNSARLTRWWVIKKGQSPAYDYDQFTGYCKVGVEIGI